MLDHVLAPMYIHMLFGAGVTPEYVDGLAQRLRRRRSVLHRLVSLRTTLSDCRPTSTSPAHRCADTSAVKDPER
ncbi:hypothetical protein GCM10018987_52300 [Streptomyces cremeus]